MPTRNPKHPLFAPHCDRDGFTDAEWRELRTHGSAMAALASGLLLPRTAAQVRFVEIFRRGRKLRLATAWERLWQKYARQLARQDELDRVPDSNASAISAPSPLDPYLSEAEFRRKAKRDEYASFMRSPRWDVLRREAIARAGGTCENCSVAEVLEVHHRNYFRFGGRELPRDLEALCNTCHRDRHDFRGRYLKSLRRED